MSKRPAREAVGQAIGGMLPEESQKAPPKPVSKAEQRQKRQKREASWGRPKTYRLSPELIEAVDLAAGEEGVPIGDFVEFMLRSSLYLLSADRIQLPVIERDRRPASKTIPKEQQPSIPAS